MTETLNISHRGEWLHLDLRLEFKGGEPGGTLNTSAAEELALASGIAELVAAFHASRADRRRPPEFTLAEGAALEQQREIIAPLNVNTSQDH